MWPSGSTKVKDESSVTWCETLIITIVKERGKIKTIYGQKGEIGWREVQVVFLEEREMWVLWRGHGKSPGPCPITRTDGLSTLHPELPQVPAARSQEVTVLKLILSWAGNWRWEPKSPSQMYNQCFQRAGWNSWTAGIIVPDFSGAGGQLRLYLGTVEKLSGKRHTKWGLSDPCPLCLYPPSAPSQ